MPCLSVLFKFFAQSKEGGFDSRNRITALIRFTRDRKSTVLVVFISIGFIIHDIFRQNN